MIRFGEGTETLGKLVTKGSPRADIAPLGPSESHSGKPRLSNFVVAASTGPWRNLSPVGEDGGLVRREDAYLKGIVNRFVDGILSRARAKWTAA